MNAYTFIFVWLILFTILANCVNVTVQENVMGNNVKRWNIIVALFAFLPVFLLASLGDPIKDTRLYISSFLNLPVSWEEVVVKFKEEESGQAFLIFGVLVKRFFGANVTIYRLFLATIHSLPLVLIFRKYSENYLLTVFLFVASACHVGWMMNGIRQFVAVVIIFAATPWLCERKYGLLIGTILLAYTFHITALVMLPVIFIVQGKTWNRKTICYIVIALIATYIFDKYTGSFEMLLVGTEFEGAITEFQRQGDDGTNPIRVLVNAIPMILAFLGRNHIRQENDIFLNICVNMSVITTGLYLISMVTSGIMVGRLPIYTSLYNCILLPNLISLIFTRDSRRIVNIVMIAFYICYYVVEMGIY